MKRRKNKHLEVKLEKDVLTISIGIEMLAFAIEAAPDLERFVEDAEEMKYIAPKITNKTEFAKAIVAALKDEEEDGSTTVHRLLDKAAEHAIEWGAEGIEYPGEII